VYCTIADLLQIAVLLDQRGYRADDIATIHAGQLAALARSAWAK
jgi:hypothetical protein